MTRISKWIISALAIVATVSLAFAVGCDYSEDGKPEEIKWKTTDTLWFAASGSTFIAPLLNRWGSDYEKTHKVHLNYQSIGSGGGIKNLRQGTGAFAASDAPLSDADLKGMPEILQIPVTAGPVSVIYNLPGLMTPLRLSGKTLASIFGGDIISWQDPAIVRDNPGLKLPHAAIIVVHRSDGSGTTAIFTNYLSKVSPEWLSKYGNGLTVPWPTGIGGDGSSVVLSTVKQTAGTIGYLELSYAKLAGLPVASIQNKAGEYVAPTTASAYLAVNASTEILARDVRTQIVDPPATAKGAYPITGLSFILIPKDNTHGRGEQQALRDLIAYSLTNGQDVAEEMSYSKLPPPVQQEGLAVMAQLTENGKPTK
ncbi:MAG: phosphate ABC transporter substrate-binding protein PstS [Acidobacteriaceae bacterium]